MSTDQNNATPPPAASGEEVRGEPGEQAIEAAADKKRKKSPQRTARKRIPREKNISSANGGEKKKTAAKKEGESATAGRRKSGAREAANQEKALEAAKCQKRSIASAKEEAEESPSPIPPEKDAGAALSVPEAPSHTQTLQPDAITGEAPRRRPGRGQKGRGHASRKTHAQTCEEPAWREPVEIALALMAVLALPPARPVKAPAAKKSPQRKKESPKTEAPAVKKRMFISVIPGEQVEVALTENGVVLEYYLDMLHQRKLKGNIYKGVIHNIDSNLQAAFVDYGAGKNGFLQIDQVHPEYWQTTPDLAHEKKFPPIQKALRTGQEILVQVVKEPTGSKGAFLTTWLSLAGRFLVLTPGQEQIGVSRKVTDPEERKRLREMMNGIDPGSGFGVIVRTVGEGATKTTLKTDLQYLKRLWREIRKKGQEEKAPALIYQEPGLSERAVRDYLTDDVSEIWVDNDAEAHTVSAMVALLFPRKKDLVRPYMDARVSLWEKFGLLGQLDQIYAREVALPSGGRLVFDQTEALMAIDINSGKISGKNNFEAMAFKTNMEAAEAIARQLRLRDIGGQIVIDFIEMRDKKHILEVEKNLRQAMKGDRARHDVSRMSSFGLLELVRQRMGSSALSICMETCAFCGGTGLRRNMEWQALQTLRVLKQKLRDFNGPRFVFDANRELGLYLLNNKRDALRKLEEDFGKSLEIRISV